MEINLQSFLFFVLGVAFAAIAPNIKRLPFLPQRDEAPAPPFTASDDAPPAHASLTAFSKSIRSIRGVFNISPGVFQARGFALGNSIMIEGSEGIVIVDTTESLAAAQEIMAEFRKLTSKPVVGIIYTHFHADHITGTAAFIEDRANPPPIYSHEDTIRQITQFLATPDLVMQRAFRQFGVVLPPKWHASSGIGSTLKADFAKERKGVTSPILPTVTFGEEMELRLAGDLELKLIHCPGETDDQIIIWMPKTKVLIPADNIYRAFPNLYAIRGNPARDPNKWIASIDRMRRLEPEVLVPCHLEAVLGKEEINRILTDYRDGIQFVLDQTLRLMNKGLHPDDLQHLIQLPENLRENPYLMEHYGTLKWSIRGIFNLYMGWFSGFAEDLEPLSRQPKAQQFLALMGGEGKVLQAAENAMNRAEAKYKESGRYSIFDSQMALELSSMVLTSYSSSSSSSSSTLAKKIRVASLKALAAEQTSANGRNYYLTQALETDGLKLELQKADGVRSASMTQIIGFMAKKVDPKKAEGVEGTLVLHFVDTQEMYVLTIRNCIVIPVKIPNADADAGADPLPADAVTLKLTDVLWREILIGERSGAWALAQGSIQVEGGTVAQVATMLGIFESV